MKIIISPAKVQNGRNLLNFPMVPIPYPEQTQFLKNTLVKMSKKDLSKLMKIKDKLLDATFTLLHEDQDEQHAITRYNGIVFKEINSHLFDDIQLQYLNRHLRILSAYYGILKPLTGIKPYRLDMTMHPNQINLYDYWHNAVNEYFDDHELIINLASLEFSQLISKPLLNIHFKEELSDGSTKVVTVRAKKARGMMVQFMVENLIEEPEKLKQFSEMNYQFSEKESDQNNYVFIASYE
ncbi:MAG: YaaA family protein [Clostridia bacterium]|nr:YaaA family protein [Clostridia bacterium]